MTEFLVEAHGTFVGNIRLEPNKPQQLLRHVFPFRCFHATVFSEGESESGRQDDGRWEEEGGSSIAHKREGARSTLSPSSSYES